MKRSIVFLMLIFSCAFTTQAQTAFAKDSLSISSTIAFEQTADFKNYQVKFKNVISDSRCPKNVMCIRAGEAKVLLSIFKDGTFKEDKEVIIDASGFVIEENNLAFIAEDFKIFGMNLKPYPKTENGIAEANYTIEIVFQPNVIK